MALGAKLGKNWETNRGQSRLIRHHATVNEHIKFHEDKRQIHSLQQTSCFLLALIDHHSQSATNQYHILGLKQIFVNQNLKNAYSGLNTHYIIACKSKLDSNNWLH